MWIVPNPNFQWYNVIKKIQTYFDIDSKEISKNDFFVFSPLWYGTTLTNAKRTWYYWLCYIKRHYSGTNFFKGKYLIIDKKWNLDSLLKIIDSGEQKINSPKYYGSKKYHDLIWQGKKQFLKLNNHTLINQHIKDMDYFSYHLEYDMRLKKYIIWENNSNEAEGKQFFENNKQIKHSIIEDLKCKWYCFDNLSKDINLTLAEYFPWFLYSYDENNQDNDFCLNKNKISSITYNQNYECYEKTLEKAWKWEIKFLFKHEREKEQYTFSHIKYFPINSKQIWIRCNFITKCIYHLNLLFLYDLSKDKVIAKKAYFWELNYFNGYTSFPIIENTQMCYFKHYEYYLNTLIKQKSKSLDFLKSHLKNFNHWEWCYNDDNFQNSPVYLPLSKAWVFSFYKTIRNYCFSNIAFQHKAFNNWIRVIHNSYEYNTASNYKRIYFVQNWEKEMLEPFYFLLPNILYVKQNKTKVKFFNWYYPLFWNHFGNINFLEKIDDNGEIIKKDIVDLKYFSFLTPTPYLTWNFLIPMTNKWRVKTVDKKDYEIFVNLKDKNTLMYTFE